jgi:hypothetical protein
MKVFGSAREKCTDSVAKNYQRGSATGINRFDGRYHVF